MADAWSSFLPQLEMRFLRKGVYSMSEVSTFRLYLLRAMYLFMFVGLAIFKWPGILNPPPGISNPGTVVGSVLGALSLLAVLGIRYPVKMLPLLIFELLWKVLWVLGWGLPLWFTQQLSPESQETLISCLMGVVLVPLVIPWGYVFKQYVKAPGDPWGKQVTLSTPTSIVQDTGRT
jgi:hypothetical protein